MAKIIKVPVAKEPAWEINFYINGELSFGFPCHQDGSPIIPETNVAARNNYAQCVENHYPYEIVYRPKVMGGYTDLICNCGCRFTLYSEYMGACSCPNCGQWYNIFGQELLPPENWEEDY